MSNKAPYQYLEAAVLGGRLRIWFLAAIPPIALAVIVFLLTFVAQVGIAAYEHTLLPSSLVRMSLVQHLTIVVGGGFLIPLTFYAMSKFYRSADCAFEDMRKHEIVEPTGTLPYPGFARCFGW